MSVPSLTKRLVGDDLIHIEVPDPVSGRRLADWLRNNGDWLDVVAGIDSVVVQVDIAKQAPESALAEISTAIPADAAAVTETTAVIEIPVVYGGDAGPDLDRVCEKLGLSREEFIDLHAGEYTVDMLGFIPGFAYIGGLDDRLKVDRLPEPRQYVPAGSLGIAGGRTGLYSLPGPGGWPLIGRTSLSLFDASADEPFSVAAGDTILFVAVDGS